MSGWRYTKEFILKYIWLAIFFMLAIVLVHGMVFADFVSSDGLAFDVTSGGDKAHQHYLLTGTVPMFGGYAGFQWAHARNDGEQSSNHFKARIEGSKHWGRVGVQAYGRYGKRSTMAQDRLLEGGLALDLKLVDTEDVGVNVGLGSYAEHETLKTEYQAVIENASVEIAPRGHLNLRWKRVSLLNEVFLSQDFKAYNTRTHGSVEIPLLKILFFEQIYLIVSGDIEYDSRTKHVDIESLQWNWAHRLQWRF